MYLFFFSFQSRNCLLLTPLQTTSVPSLCLSPALQEMVFTSHCSNFLSHQTVTLHYIPETFAHRQIRLKRLRQLMLSKKNTLSPSHSPTKVIHFYILSTSLSLNLK